MSYHQSFKTLPDWVFLSFYVLSLHVIELLESCFTKPSWLLAFSKVASVTNQARQRRYKITMATNRKTNKGGHYLRYDPSDMNLLNEGPTYLEFLRRTGCFQFFQILQGCHVQVSKEFSISFNGTASKVGMLNLTITLETIATST